MNEKKVYREALLLEKEKKILEFSAFPEYLASFRGERTFFFTLKSMITFLTKMFNFHTKEI